jgi:hypothetical protein
MLKDLHIDKTRLVADLAKSARTQRDLLLGTVPERDLDGLTPGRGEHNPTAELGLQSIPLEVSRQAVALREAVASLSEPARRELYTLVRIGKGHLAVENWERGLSDGEMLGDGAITAEIIDDPDLHDHISKGLYEVGLVG